MDLERTVHIKRLTVKTDPNVDVFSVQVHSQEGVWQETLATEELLKAFLRGVQAGAAVVVSIPEIPKKAEDDPYVRIDQIATPIDDEDVPF